MSHPVCQSPPVTLNREEHLGEVVEIASSVDRSLLPAGLSPGFQVRLVGLDADIRIVEREGREWRVRSHQICPRFSGAFPRRGIPGIQPARRRP